MGGPVGKLLILHANAFVNVLVPAGTRRTGPAAEVMSAYREPFAKRSQRLPTYVLAREILQAREYLADLERGLERLRHLPALIVWGDPRRRVSRKERRRFQELFPTHRTVVLGGAGHFVQEDAPGEIVEAIRDWGGGRDGSHLKTRALRQRAV